jgi:hypothetical protein
MNEAVVLTPERILEATEDVLRRFGLTKATVVDVARALDVSHGSVLPPLPQQGFAARRGGQALARTRQRAAVQDRGELGPGAGAAGEMAAHRPLPSSRRRSATIPRCSRPTSRWRRTPARVVEAYKDKQVDLVAKILADGRGARRVRDGQRQGDRACRVRCDRPLPSPGACRGMGQAGMPVADRCVDRPAAEGRTGLQAIAVAFPTVPYIF